MKVKVCMPDPLKLCEISRFGGNAVDKLYNFQGKIIVIQAAENIYLWSGLSFPKEWFKVVEETLYQKWRNTDPPDLFLDKAFDAGRESLKPFLKKTLEWIDLNFDKCPTNPVGLRENIREELER